MDGIILISEDTNERMRAEKSTQMRMIATAIKRTQIL